MAVIWQRSVDGVDVQIRSAGRCLRLYTDGIFQSQYHPENLVTGSVWDLLALPVFMFRCVPQRILLLGVGGGTVIHQLQGLGFLKTLTGIELSSQQLGLARRFFNLEYANVELIAADAIQWVNHYHGAGYDLVIDDLFFLSGQEASRAQIFNDAWTKALFRVLKPDGNLVVNFSGLTEYEQATSSGQILRHLFPHRAILQTARCDNAVAVFGQRRLAPLDAQEIQRNPFYQRHDRRRRLNFTQFQG